MSHPRGSVWLLALLALCACGAEEPAPGLPLLESHEFQDLLGRSRAEEIRAFKMFAGVLVKGVLDELPKRMAALAANREEMKALTEKVSTNPPPAVDVALSGPQSLDDLPQHLEALADAVNKELTAEQKQLMRKQLAELSREATPESLKRAVESEGAAIGSLREYAAPDGWFASGKRPKNLYGWFRRMQRRPLAKDSEWDRRVAAHLAGVSSPAWRDGDTPADIVVQRILQRVLDYEDMFWAVVVILRYGKPTRFEGEYRAMLERTQAGIIDIAADRILREWRKIMLALDQYLTWEYDRASEEVGEPAQMRGPPSAAARDNAGPTITVVRPSASRGFVLPTEAARIEVAVRAEDPSGVARVSINGGEATVSSNGLYTRSVALTGKSLAIDVRAEDTLGNARTWSGTIAKSDGEAVLETAREGRDLALVIGCEAYDDWSPLSNPVKDATAVRDTLRDTYGFETELVTNPTKSELQRKLLEYVSKSFAPDDQLFIFYAGHGHYDEPPLDLGYLVLKDSKVEDELRETYIRHDSLLVLIDRIPCPHILVVLDACFGGAAFEARMGRGTRGTGDVMADISIDEMVKRKMPLRTRKLITSGGTEYVWDGPARQHSPFASRLLGALRALDGHSEGILTYPRLLGAVELGKPGAFGGSLPGDDPGSDFLFIKRSK